MVSCERCHNNLGEWQCQVCKRVVCTDCARPTKDGVFCQDHEPSESEKRVEEVRESPTTASFRTLFLSMLFLTAGIGGIYLVFKYFTAGFEGIPGSGVDFTQTIAALESSVMIIVLGLSTLTVILGAAYFYSKRKESS